MATAANTIHKIQKTQYVVANNTMIQNADMIIRGNLTIIGGQTYANSQTLLVRDNIITLNAAINQSGVPTMDAGIEIDRGSEQNVALMWKESESVWQFTNDGVNYETLGGGSAGSYANSAFAQANAAFASANNVAPQVQPAFDKANAAYAFANTTSAWGTRQAFVATAGQTTFAPGSGYLPGSVDVYYNGLKLYGGEDYTATDGVNVVLTNPATVNSIVEVIGFGANSVAANVYVLNSMTSLLNRETFFATAGQTTFTPSQKYRVGYIDVYYNGLKLNVPEDVVANDGTSIYFVGLTPSTDDVIEVVGLTPNVALANAIPITGGTVSGGLTLTGNVLPTTDNTYYLGSATKRWHSLFVGPGSIDIGGLKLSNSNGMLSVASPGQPATPLAGEDNWVRAHANAAFLAANSVNVYGANTTNTSHFTLPIGTTAQRPASAANGSIRFNSSLNRIEVYMPRGGWVNLVQDQYEIEYLVVAGGGGGGGWGGGGGGAGGLRSSVQTDMSGGGASAEAKFIVTPGNTYSIIVGGGGAHGAVGTNSSFATIISNGGGYGAGSGAPVTSPQQPWINAVSGGSGGGATWIYTTSTGVAGTGTSNQGYPGGGPVTWINGGNHASSGGGGAGGAGILPASQAGPSGNGGIGVVSTIDGNNYYYAGGGGAAIHYTVNAGSGGLGGGGGGGAATSPAGIVGIGGGSARNPGTAGTLGGPGGPGGTNTGGGGGAGSPTTSAYAGGTGGSGIVILRYQGAQRGTGGSVSTVGSYTVHTFTGSGSFIA